MVPADSAGYRTGGRGRLYGCRRLLGALPCTGLKGEQDRTHKGRRLMQRGEGLVPLPPVDASRVWARSIITATENGRKTGRMIRTRKLRLRERETAGVARAEGGCRKEEPLPSLTQGREGGHVGIS